ncbi:MAG: hypothetical protein QME81_04190 [bacterium]|nr:hypothetical protein [bacterium]
MPVIFGVLCVPCVPCVLYVPYVLCGKSGLVAVGSRDRDHKKEEMNNDRDTF